MTRHSRLRRFLASLAVVASLSGVFAVGAAKPAAAANWNASCTSSYWVATGSGFSPDEAHKACARNVWNKRYGNIGGWTITGISYSLTSAQVSGRRPGTSLYVTAFSRLV